MANTGLTPKQIPIHGRVLCIDLVSKTQGVSFKITNETGTAIKRLVDDLCGCDLEASSASSMRTGRIHEQLRNIVFLVARNGLNATEKSGLGYLPSSAVIEVINKIQRKLTDYGWQQVWSLEWCAFR